MSSWVFVAPTAAGKAGPSSSSAFSASAAFPAASSVGSAPPSPAEAGLPAATAVAPGVLVAALLLGCGLFAFLWFAGSTWWRPAWYGAAVLQGVSATLLLLTLSPGAAAASSTRAPPALLAAMLLLCCGAPLAHAVFLEAVLEDPDRGDGRTAWAVTAGKALSVAAVAAALASGYIALKRNPPIQPSSLTA